MVLKKQLLKPHHTGGAQEYTHYSKLTTYRNSTCSDMMWCICVRVTANLLLKTVQLQTQLN